MKKLLSVFLCLSMLISICSVGIFADDTWGELTVEADKTDVKAGDTVTYTVYLGDCSALTDGVFNVSFNLSIPKGVTFVEKSGAVDSGFAAATNFLNPKFKETNLLFGSIGALDEGYTGGKVKIMTFQCTVDNDAAGDLAVTLVNTKFTDSKGKNNIPSVTEAEVTVAVPATGISIKTDEGTTVEVGETIGLQAVLEPQNSTDAVLWSASNNEGSVEITSLGGKNENIDIKGTAVGTVTITAKAGNQSATCTVTVVPAKVPLTDIDFVLYGPDNFQYKVNVGESTNVFAYLTPANTTDKIIWEIKDDSKSLIEIVEIRSLQNGDKFAKYASVKGLSKGKATITVKGVDPDNEKIVHYSENVTVDVLQPVTGLTVTPDEVALDVGGSADITANVQPETADDPTVTWTSADTEVATVADGTITAKAAGDTTVTAAAGNYSATIAVHVHNYNDYDKDADGHQPVCSCGQTSGNKEAHTYDYTSTETKHTGTCSVCGYVVEEEHTFGDWETVTEATETSDGLQKRSCSVCKYEEKKVTPKLPHKHELEPVAEVPADCDNPGTKAHYICKKDSSELFLDDKGQIAVTAEDLIIPALGHNYVVSDEKSVAPTCTEKGKKVSICSNCSNEIEEELAALGHTPGDIVQENVVNATCTVPGSYDEVQYCTVCKAEIEGSRRHIENQTIAHNYQEVSRTPASCTAEGSVVSECTMCHEKITTAIPATGHTWGSWIIDKEATEDEEGEQHRECTVCHEVERQVIPKKGQTPIYVGPYVAPVYFGYLDIFPWINNPYVPTQPATAPEPAAPAPTEPVEVTPSVYGPTGQVVDWHSPFTDVTTENEYYEAIGYVYGENLFLGKTEDFFGVNDPMTRGMFVTVLGRLANVNVSKYSGTSFSDVDVEMYYAPYIEWAAANNIVLGMGDGTFEPETNVTVEQAVAIIARYARFANAYNPSSFDLSGYADFEQIDDWALSDMSWAAFTGVYTGKDGKLTPVDEATRGIVASMLWKYAK